MDIETLRMRARLLQDLRRFFIERGYLEADTPVLSNTLIPESCLEIFETRRVSPDGASSPLYLIPSPEIYLKRLIARHKTPLFQISKCFRNFESVGTLHNPEFTMLEYYSVGADYLYSAELTEALFDFLLDSWFPNGGAPGDLRPPFTRLTVEEAFERCAGISLREASEDERILYARAEELGLRAGENDDWSDVYDLLFVHAVEPNLPKDKPVLLMDYPARISALAKDGADGFTNERWELYARGVELANCYTEETDPRKVASFFKRESEKKTRRALTRHAIDERYADIFKNFPECSGAAMGVDRLLMLLLNKKSLDTVIPFYDFA